MILTVVTWILVILVGWFLGVRIVRQFVHFPIPPFLARFIDNPFRRRIQPAAKALDWIGIEDSMCVLEIGPGPGTFTIEAAKRVGGNGRVFAVDIEPAEISRLNRRLQREKITNVTTREASAYELPFPERSFDRVFMVTVLAEIPDRKRALLEIKRVLKDDGILGIGEFLLDPDYPRQKTVVSWCKSADLEQVAAHGGLAHYVVTFRKKRI